MPKRWKRNSARLNKTLEEMIDEASEWDKRYLEVTVRSLELYDRDDHQELITKFLRRRARPEFYLVNHHSKRLWIADLLEAFERSRQDNYRRSWDESLLAGKVACGLVTLTDEKWACSDRRIQFDLARAKQKVRNALAGTSFIACFEAAIYKNEKWETDGREGHLINFHCHAVIWGNSRYDLNKLRKRARLRFKPILSNKSGFRMDSLKRQDDLEKTILYIAKMPVLGYRTLSNGTKKRQRSSKITFRSRRQLFHFMKNYKTFDVWLGSGEGRAIIRKAKRAVMKRAGSLKY